MMLGARTAAWAKAGAPLPYDAEVEWLQGDGRSYIRTGVYAEIGDVITVSASPIDANGSSQYSVYGCGLGDTSALQSRNYLNGFDLNIRNRRVSMPVDDVSKFYTYSCELIDDGLVANFWGTEKTLYNPGLLDHYELFLFAVNWNEAAYRVSKIKISSLSVKRNGFNVVDFIPVRGFDNTGYMYDSVSGKLFGNDGTGAFVIGPDKTV